MGRPKQALVPLPLNPADGSRTTCENTQPKRQHLVQPATSSTKNSPEPASSPRENFNCRLRFCLPSSGVQRGRVHSCSAQPVSVIQPIHPSSIRKCPSKHRGPLPICIIFSSFLSLSSSLITLHKSCAAHVIRNGFFLLFFFFWGSSTEKLSISRGMLLLSLVDAALEIGLVLCFHPTQAYVLAQTVPGCRPFLSLSTPQPTYDKVTLSISSTPRCPRPLPRLGRFVVCGTYHHFYLI